MWNPTRRLYACEFSDGTVKVGITGQQGAQRFNTSRLNGEQPSRFYCGPLHECKGSWSERELLQRMQNLGGVVVRGREWFREISFTTACVLVEVVTADAIAHEASLAASIPSRLIQEAGVPLS